MKVTYRTADGRMSIEFEASSQQHAWRELAGFQETFEASTKCGICGCKWLRFAVRENSGGSFFELHCRNEACRARKSFGRSRDGGGLFPHRKDARGNRLLSNGWIKWEGGTKDG